MKLHKINYGACQGTYLTWIKNVGSKLQLSRWPLVCACIGEFFGTTLLIIFGLGCSTQKTLGNYSDKSDFLSLSFNWGIGVCMSLFVSGVMGAGIMNPAITFAFAIVGKIPLIRIIPYTLCQIFGAWVGTMLLLTVYNQQIKDFTLKHDRGQRLMNDTGSIFVTSPCISHGYCVLDQIFGTSLLAGMALAVGDKHNFNIQGSLKPLYINVMWIGLKNSISVGCGGASNPARDFGPRVALLMVGWGPDAFSYSDFYFWVPIVGPYIGALVGALAYELLFGVHMAGLNAKWQNQATKSSDEENTSNGSSGDGDPKDTDEEALILFLPRHSRIVRSSSGRVTIRLPPECSSVTESTGTSTTDQEPESDLLSK